MLMVRVGRAMRSGRVKAVSGKAAPLEAPQ